MSDHLPTIFIETPSASSTEGTSIVTFELCEGTKFVARLEMSMALFPREEEPKERAVDRYRNILQVVLEEFMHAAKDPASFHWGRPHVSR